MVDFTVILLAESFASSVAITLDMLATAASVAQRRKRAAPRWKVVSPDGGPVVLSNGLTILTGRLAVRGKDRSAWVIPGLGAATPAMIAGRLAREDAQRAAQAIRRHAGAGGTVAASCSAVFLLHAAGILEGRTVTTTWWLAPLLRKRMIGGMVEADRIVAADGNVVTAGAALAHTDLMLYLLRKSCGADVTEEVSRLMLLDGRTAQAQYIVPAVLAGADATVLQLTRRVEQALPNVPSVAALARELGMSERTLARQVFAATGETPLALIQHVRLFRARSLLESSRLPVADVAAQVGYRDATALFRLLKRRLGVSPSKLRVAAHR